MLDVNHFKRINDKYGHVEGDYALKTVAQTLKTVAMKYGHDLFIGRYGGDEFTALYECNSEKKVKELCLEIKTTLKNITEDNKYLLTVGTGYACYTGKEMKLALLYDLADKALYADKDAMKNAETHIIV
jgi:diguanylate cyclase (GGDEF)-like protein